MEERPTCRVCRATHDPTDPAALAWSREPTGEGAPRLLCPACTRRHSRDIEARLPDAWW